MYAPNVDCPFKTIGQCLYWFPSDFSAAQSLSVGLEKVHPLGTINVCLEFCISPFINVKLSQDKCKLNFLVELQKKLRDPILMRSFISLKKEVRQIKYRYLTLQLGISLKCLKSNS